MLGACAATHSDTEGQFTVNGGCCLSLSQQPVFSHRIHSLFYYFPKWLTQSLFSGKFKWCCSKDLFFFFFFTFHDRYMPSFACSFHWVCKNKTHELWHKKKHPVVLKWSVIKITARLTRAKWYSSAEADESLRRWARYGKEVESTQMYVGELEW